MPSRRTALGLCAGPAPQELGCLPSCTHSSALSSSASTSGRYRHQRTAWASAALSPLADRDHKPLRWLRRAWSPGFSVELADAGLAPAGMRDPLRTGTFPGLRLTWRFLVCPVPARPRDGLRLCRNCVASSRAVTCSRCGVVREAATRDERGQPLCPPSSPGGQDPRPLRAAPPTPPREPVPAALVFLVGPAATTGSIRSSIVQFRMSSSAMKTFRLNRSGRCSRRQGRGPGSD